MTAMSWNSGKCYPASSRLDGLSPDAYVELYGEPDPARLAVVEPCPDEEQP